MEALFFWDSSSQQLSFSAEDSFGPFAGQASGSITVSDPANLDFILTETGNTTNISVRVMGFVFCMKSLIAISSCQQHDEDSGKNVMHCAIHG